MVHLPSISISGSNSTQWALTVTFYYFLLSTLVFMKIVIVTVIHKTSYHYFIRGAPNSGSGESRTPAIFWKSCSGRIPLKYSAKGRIVVLNVNIFLNELNWLIFIDRGQSGNSFIFLHYDRRRGSTAVSEACSFRTTH